MSALAQGNVFEKYGGTKANVFEKYGGGGKSVFEKYSGAAADDVSSKIAEIESEFAERGMAPPAPAGKGLGRILVDLLSRPNYAVAGAVEEALQQPTAFGQVTAGAGRAARELFSGLPGVQGEKRGFGEVMQRAGVPAGPTANIIPWPTGAGVEMLPVTARGAAGLAGDIAFDPLTYLTFGTSTGTRFVGKGGVKFLSKQGAERLAQVTAKYAPAFDAVANISDDAVRLASTRKVRAALVDAFEPLLADKALLEPGGAKLFGKTVIPAGTLKAVSEPLQRALVAVPGGEKALEGAKQFAEASRVAIAGAFGAFGKLAGLPKGMREAAIRMNRDFVDANAAIAGRLFNKAATIEPDWQAIVKADPDIGRKFYEIREGTGTHKLTAKQADVYGRITKLYDEMEASGLALGVIDPEQAAKYAGRYMHHAYLNAEDMSEVAVRYGRPGAYPKTTERFQRPRVFDSYDEAKKVSGELHKNTVAARAAGITGPVYPVLEPNYDVMNNLYSYIHQHSEAIARKLWYEDASRVFGQGIGEYDTAAIYDLMKPTPGLGWIERTRIDAFFGKSKTLRALEEHATEAKFYPKDIRTEGLKDWELVRKRAYLLLPQLSDVAKREFFREMATRVKSPSQFSQIVLEFDPAYAKYFPDAPHAIKPGDIEPSLEHLGEKARYVQRAGGLWGDKPVMIPEAIADDIENFSSKLFEPSQAGWRKMLRGYDWLNNWFKVGVYTPFPSSATRDIYSNVLQSHLDIGIGALRRGTDTASVIFGKNPDEIVRLGTRTFTQKQLRDLATDYGVLDPSGRQFVQMTGRAQFSPTGKVSKLIAKRASIDNFSRVQLWLNNIARGVDPRDAADKVGEFLFRYNELSPLEREGMRRLIPFYTYTRKAIPLYLKQIATRPGRVAAQIKPFRGRESENDSLAQWEAEGFKVRLDSDGKTLRVLAGVDLPIRTADTLWRGDGAKTIRGILGMMSPAIKTPIEQATGQDLFTGRSNRRVPAPALGRFLENHASESMKNYFGYDKTTDAAGRPVYTVRGTNEVVVLARAWMFSRVLSTSDRQFREYFGDDPKVAAGVLDFLTDRKSVV